MIYMIDKTAGPIGEFGFVSCVFCSNKVQLSLLSQLVDLAD